MKGVTAWVRALNLIIIAVELRLQLLSDWHTSQAVVVTMATHRVCASCTVACCRANRRSAASVAIDAPVRVRADVCYVS